jgi:hypothetical protein
MGLLARRLKFFAIAALFEGTIVKQSDLAPSMWTFRGIFDTVVAPHYRFSRQF